MHDYNYNTNAKKSNTYAVKIDIPDKQFINTIMSEKDNFFDIDNRNIYSKYFTEAEAEELRSLSQSKISSAIITKAMENTSLSQKTIYSILNGNKSTLTTLMKLLDFFGVNLVTNFSFQKEAPTLRENINFKYTAKKHTEDESLKYITPRSKLLDKITTLDENQLIALTTYVDFLLSQKKDKTIEEIEISEKNSNNRDITELNKYKLDVSE